MADLGPLIEAISLDTDRPRTTDSSSSQAPEVSGNIFHEGGKGGYWAHVLLRERLKLPEDWKVCPFSMERGADCDSDLPDDDWNQGHWISVLRFFMLMSVIDAKPSPGTDPPPYHISMEDRLSAAYFIYFFSEHADKFGPQDPEVALRVGGGQVARLCSLGLEVRRIEGCISDRYDSGFLDLSKALDRVVGDCSAVK